MLEVTKARVLEVELSSSLNNAAHSALSQYDPVLFHEYGLFAGEQSNGIHEIIQKSLDVSFYPSSYSKNEYLLDKLLFNQSNKISTLMEPNMVQYGIGYEAFLDDEMRYVTDKIVDYMALRKYYVMLEPFLEKTSILSTTAKTSQILEEKSELLSEIEVFNQHIEKLMLYFDSVSIDKKGYGSIDYSRPYIRKVGTVDISYRHFASTYQNNYKKNAIYLEEVFQQLEIGRNKADKMLERILSVEIDVQEWEEAEEETHTERFLLRKINALAEIEEIYFLPSYKALEDVGELLYLHKDALGVIDEYQNMGIETVKKIEVFQKRIDEGEDLYEGVAKSIHVEMNQLKSELDGSNISENEVNNLNLFKERLEKNITVLEGCKESLEEVIDYSDDYIMRRYTMLKKESQYSKIEKLIIDGCMRMRFSRNTRPLRNIHWNEAKEKILTAMKSYTTDFYMNYHGMNEMNHQDEEEKYTQWIQEIQNIDFISMLEWEENEFVNLFRSIQTETLPSYNFSGYNQYTHETSDVNRKTTKDVFIGLGQVSNKFNSLYEDMMIHEYILGMFTSKVTHLNENARSLSGYAVNDHFLKYETEYILGGYQSEIKNLQYVLGIILAIRIGCNAISLAADGEKRMQIQGIANGIAGWWTGGVGGVVLSVVIATAWAMMESVIDVYVLVSGGSLPLIKTKTTWYSSIDGNWKELMDKSLEEKSIKKELLYLDYTDYLRLLFLLDFDTNTIKVARIMDVIQLNLQDKYKDDQKQLKNYFRGITIDGTLQIPVTQKIPLYQQLKNKLWEYHVKESARY